MHTMTKPRLRVVPGDCADATRFPDFFCIGPQRTGSTWLHANLVRHPEILMHRDKETFFFSTLGDTASPRYRYPDLKSYLASFTDTIGELVLKNYHAIRRCGRFYSPQVIGESTASYCVLDRSVLEDIQLLNPDLKIIMLVRDPIERAWSHANKDLVRDTGMEATDSQYLEFFSRSDQLERADYPAMIERWQAILKPGHMLLAPSSRIEAEPEKLISEILDFLGVLHTRPASKRHLVSRQNPTSGNAIPRHLRSELHRILGHRMESYDALIEKMGSLMII
jgi:hypothetical protein